MDDCNHDRRHPTAKCGKDDASLSDVQLDDTDRILLTVARHFFRDQSFPDQGHRRVAVSIAEISFGYGRGTAMAAAVLRAIKAMRMARRDTFFYRNPDYPVCSGLVTDAELHLVQVFRSVRMGQSSAASAHAMLLCEGNDYALFLDAVSQVFCAFSGSRWQCDTGSWLLD